VQTFLPYPDFRASAAVLDTPRLGKQRVETYQILRALTWPTYGWKNHPAVRMWRGFTPALVTYGLAICDAWEGAGRADSTRKALLNFTRGVVPEWQELYDCGQLPQWIGRSDVHRSHQASLVRKNPEHYRPFFPDVPADLPYAWPESVFPRWPIRRGHDEPLDVGDAAAQLGVTNLTDQQLRVIDALRAGEDATVSGPIAVSTAVLAGLSTPGTTLWAFDGPALTAPGPAPAPAETLGRVSEPTAREPGPAELAAMATEASAVPEFAFLRTSQLTDGVVARLRAGLVVADGPVPVRAEIRGSLPMLGIDRQTEGG
jgi:Pyrimidine dimer DNA glycosylase